MCQLIIKHCKWWHFEMPCTRCMHIYYWEFLSLWIFFRSCIGLIRTQDKTIKQFSFLPVCKLLWGWSIIQISVLEDFLEWTLNFEFKNCPILDLVSAKTCIMIFQRWTLSLFFFFFVNCVIKAMSQFLFLFFFFLSFICGCVIFTLHFSETSAGIDGLRVINYLLTMAFWEKIAFSLSNANLKGGDP